MTTRVAPSRSDVGRRDWLRQVAATTAALFAQSRLLSAAQTPPGPIRVHIWSEGSASRSVYPEDIDGTLAQDLRTRPEMTVSTSRLDDPDCGLPDSLLDTTDVLVWWGRLRHDELPDARCTAVVDRIRAGRLGLVALHTSFASKPFRALMGTSCSPGGWRMDGRPEHIEVASANHPIGQGIEPFVIPRSSLFAEPFTVPEPECVVLLSRWDTGETFRSGLTWTIGQGRVVYLRPGHESFPDLFHPAVRQLIANSVTWAARR